MVYAEYALTGFAVSRIPADDERDGDRLGC